MKRQITVEVLVTPADRDSALRDDVRRGLTAPEKWIPPVWFYDETGSRLFDEITRLPEYYPTRTERSILATRAEEIVEMARPDTLVEVGSGTSEKTRLLLDAMATSGSLTRIVLLDISEEVLRDAAASLGAHYDVDVHAVVGDFRVDLPKLPRTGRQLWAFLGSTIGNFTPDERGQILSDFQASMGPDDHLLLGTDLIKDEQRLVAAYDDSEGVTAAFNRNVLNVLNNVLGATFHPATFDHVALWNAPNRWIEMRLRSTEAQAVDLRQLDMRVEFQVGEEILTEISCKFDPDLLPAEFARTALTVQRSWRDPAGDFMLTLAAPDF